MKNCDSVIRGMVITMNPDRDVYSDGYVAIHNGRVIEAGLASQCDYVSVEELCGNGRDTHKC